VKTPNLRAWREAKGHSQRSLAKEANINHFTVLRAERGEDIRPTNAAKIAGALGITVADLMAEEDRPPAPLSGGPSPSTSGQPRTEALLENPHIVDWVSEHEGKHAAMSDAEFEDYLLNDVDPEIDEDGIPQGLVRLGKLLDEEEEWVDKDLRRELSHGGRLYQKADFSTPEAERRTIRDAQESARLGWELSRRYGRRRRQLAAHSRRLYDEGRTRHYLTWEDRAWRA
jgi:transcriptional regulator with XRE-family HTH domain